MALNIKLLYGTKENLPPQKDGQLLFTTNEGAIYLDIGGSRIDLYKILIADAKTTGITAQSKVDTLEAKVGNIAEGTTIVEMIKALEKEIVGSESGDSSDKSLSEQIAENSAAIKVNTDAIALLNDEDATKEGSIAKAVADAVAGIVSGAPEAYDTLVEISNWIATHGSDATAMNAQITANKNDIAELKEALGYTEPEEGEDPAPIESVEDKITAAIEALDVDEITGDGKYIAAIKQVDGKIQATLKSLPDTDGLEWGSFTDLAESV